MPSSSSDPKRTLGLLGATGVGVGAIVGGGILALAGVAFATAGPSAILAFALNGAVAALTVLSFSELATRFPQSGGTYTYARKVLTVEAAFTVGWVVWFASVVAAVLYALGFAIFLVPILEQLYRTFGATPPEWIAGRFAMLTYGAGAVGFYIWSLSNSASGGRQWATIGKLIVFVALIAGGFWVLLVGPPPTEPLSARFRPFFENGAHGLLQAMGYTFIALQGFDLIAAVGGEVRDPEKNIPRAMFLSLGTALVIYLPLLFLIVAVGVPSGGVGEAARANPAILVADAGRRFLGSTGYWLVVTAGVLSMLSALRANLLAASSFARTMAADRTLPRQFAAFSGRYGAPVAAVRLTGITVLFVLIAVPNVAAAGAVSSLIFLGTFALVHGIAYLARKRAITSSPFRTLWFPLVPVVGGGLCLVLSLFQAVAVPSAGVLAALWLSLGAILFVTFLGPRAKAVDAAAEAFDPEILRLRGKRPLILVPIANPASAATLVTMAGALAPRSVSRVQLLSVVNPSDQHEGDGLPQELIDAQSVLGSALSAARSTNLRPEALITIHEDPWAEIVRVARRSRCQSILLGIGPLGESVMAGPVEDLIARVDADVVVLRAPPSWSPDSARRILVPSRGGRAQSSIRARLIGSLSRVGDREITYLGILPERATRDVRNQTLRQLQKLASDEAPGAGKAVLATGDDVVAEIVDHAANCDLLVLGLRRSKRRRKVFGEFALKIARQTDCPIVLIDQRS